jgi:hypothetical protein
VRPIRYFDKDLDAYLDIRPSSLGKYTFTVRAYRLGSRFFCKMSIAGEKRPALIRKMVRRYFQTFKFGWMSTDGRESITFETNPNGKVTNIVETIPKPWKLIGKWSQ